MTDKDTVTCVELPVLPETSNDQRRLVVSEDGNTITLDKKEFKRSMTKIKYSAMFATVGAFVFGLLL